MAIATAFCVGCGHGCGASVLHLMDVFACERSGHSCTDQICDFGQPPAAGRPLAPSVPGCPSAARWCGCAVHGRGGERGRWAHTHCPLSRLPLPARGAQAVPCARHGRLPPTPPATSPVRRQAARRMGADRPLARAHPWSSFTGAQLRPSGGFWRGFTPASAGGFNVHSKSLPPKALWTTGQCLKLNLNNRSTYNAFVQSLSQLPPPIHPH